jgi:hypothetical protein
MGLSGLNTNGRLIVIIVRAVPAPPTEQDAADPEDFVSQNGSEKDLVLQREQKARLVTIFRSRASTWLSGHTVQMLAVRQGEKCMTMPWLAVGWERSKRRKASMWSAPGNLVRGVVLPTQMSVRAARRYEPWERPPKWRRLGDSLRALMDQFKWVY